MLTGDRNLIKPDRMLKRFVSDATDVSLQNCNDELVIDLITYAANQIDGMYPRRLDSIIWRYQRMQQ
jgi:hypothetical protein